MADKGGDHPPGGRDSFMRRVARIWVHEAVDASWSLEISLSACTRLIPRVERLFRVVMGMVPVVPIVNTR